MATYTWSVPTGKAITGTTFIKDTDNYISDTINDLVDFVNSQGAHAGQGLLYDIVDKLSAQDISGSKTFLSALILQAGATVAGDITTTGQIKGITPISPEDLTRKDYVDALIADIINAAPGTLDTLNELAAALGDDPNFATTITNLIALKAPIDSPTFTGTVTLPSGTETVVKDTTPQLGGDLDCNGKTLNKLSVRQIADASIGTGTYTFDYNNGDMQQLTATGNISIAFTGFPAGSVAGFIIDCINFGAYTITHPTGMLTPGGLFPTYTASGTDRILVTSDKDGVLTLTVIGRDIKA